MADGLSECAIVAEACDVLELSWVKMPKPELNESVALNAIIDTMIKISSLM